MRKIIVLLLFLSLATYIAYEVLIYVDENFKYGRMRETPAVRPHEQAPLITDQGIVPFDGGEEMYRVADAHALESPLPRDEHGTVEQGKTLYFKYCVHCHGKDHDGNGTVGQSFQPLPTDLRSTKVQSLPDGVLFKEVSYGIPNGRQPPLATTIEVSDRWRIIAYLKSLGVRN